MDQEDAREIEKRAEREVDEAVEFAENSPEPDPVRPVGSLYVNPPPKSKRKVNGGKLPWP